MTLKTKAPQSCFKCSRPLREPLSHLFSTRITHWTKKRKKSSTFSRKLEGSSPLRWRKISFRSKMDSNQSMMSLQALSAVRPFKEKLMRIFRTTMTSEQSLEISGTSLKELVAAGTTNRSNLSKKIPRIQKVAWTRARGWQLTKLMAIASNFLGLDLLTTKNLSKQIESLKRPRSTSYSRITLAISEIWTKPGAKRRLISLKTFKL